MKTDYRKVLRERAKQAREPFEHKALDHVQQRNIANYEAWLVRRANADRSESFAVS